MACSGKLISLLMCNHQHPLLWGRFVWWSEHINRGNETNATQNMSGMQGVYSSFYCSHLYVSLHTDGDIAPRLIQTNRNLRKLYVLQAAFAPFLLRPSFAQRSNDEAHAHTSHPEETFPDSCHATYPPTPFLQLLFPHAEANPLFWW